MTLCATKRNNAEEGIRAMVGERSTAEPPPPEAADTVPEPETEVSLPVVARDRIRARVAHHVEGEDPEHLIDTIRAVHSYATARTNAGADSCVDIAVQWIVRKSLGGWPGASCQAGVGAFRGR